MWWENFQISPLFVGLVISLQPIAALNLPLLYISTPSWLHLCPGYSALLPSIFSGVCERFWLIACRRNFWIFPQRFFSWALTHFYPILRDLYFANRFHLPYLLKTSQYLFIYCSWKHLFIWKSKTFDIKKYRKHLWENPIAGVMNCLLN